MANFFKRLSYSIGNEDWKTEQKALAIKSDDTILTVSASGDRPLNLLYSNCKEIIALDANPFQTALCDLKKAALQDLDYDEYIAFLGLTPHKDRLSVLKKLEHLMQEHTVSCWRANREKIQRGIIYQGQVEKLCHKVSHVIKAVDGKKIHQLFSFDALEEQKRFIDQKWNWKIWKMIVDICLNPLFSRLLLKDPGLYQNLGLRPSTYMYNRLEKALTEIPIKENLVLSLLFQGKVYKEGFSPHLNEQESRQIKKRLDRLALKTTNMLSFLESAPDQSIDCFSLSDIASYMNKKDFHRLCRGVYRVAKPGARFCIRQFMSAHEFPEDLASHFARDPALEKALEKEDRCFVYQFNVGTILK